MGLSAKLMLRQGQSLVMTPQLLQAIKLLQLSNVELTAFVDEELERNPLLERAEDGPEAGETAAPGEDSLPGEDGERDWNSATLETDTGALEAGLGTELGNEFDGERTVATLERDAPTDLHGVSEGAWSGSGPGVNGTGGAPDGEAPNLEAYVAERPSLSDHLNAQLAVACPDPVDRAIGATLIDLVDEAGYFTGDLAEIAGRLGAPLARVERLLAVIQTFEPTGVGARNLAECLAIQLKERDRFDPAMQALVANLPLLAKRDFAALRRFCGVDEEDMADMAAELRRLDPKPGRAYGGHVEAPVAPDVFVRPAADGSWHLELNSDALPKVLVNHAYAQRVSRAGGSDADKTFISGCLQTANWLTKSLEQRARTILKVSAEIVRQQDGFFAYGVEHLRPLNLKMIADAIGMHESTVSRVTSSKYMATPRGLFELKYFFTAAIQATGGGESHSAEAVRHRIKQMIDAESANDVLSDDAIVARLRESKIDIARRTVAKYRESLRIPSSIERRREKQSMRPCAS
ncbi:MAG: RNA polymerase factor sigma-54 [Rhizobiales bacterium]|nr:RNA polymerase factor sigma-54 [Hyphomicrobiales bacterium]